MVNESRHYRIDDMKTHDLKLEGGTAVITGAASGIGLELAKQAKADKKTARQMKKINERNKK